MFDFLVISNDILPFISVTQKILSLMSIILPIVLIIVIAIDLIKAVMAADDEQLAKSVKIAKKRVLLCIAFYMLPSLINIAIVQVYKSGAITSEQYSEIKDIFDKTINVSKIDVNDSSKNKEIEQSLSKNFAISVDEDLLQTTRNNEKNVIELSKKVLTSVLTSKNIVNKYIDRIDFCGTDCILHYDGNAYSINTDAYVNKVIVGYSDINSIRVIKDSTKYVVTMDFKNATINQVIKENGVVVKYTYNSDLTLSTIDVLEGNNALTFITTIKSNEEKNIIDKSSKYIIDVTSNYTKLDELTITKMKKIYSINSRNMVMLNAYYNSAVVSTASGMFLTGDVILTSWSFLYNALMNSQELVISNTNKKVYQYEGVISINEDLDLALIKLSSSNGSYVSLNDTTSKNNVAVLLSTKTGLNISLSAGIVTSFDDNLTLLLPTSITDLGGALFNDNGKLIGMITSKSINDNYSNATSSKYINEWQQKLLNNTLTISDITPLEELKEKYFYKKNNIELIKTKVNTKIWNEYKVIGDVENTIILNLVKIGYYNKNISLRYINDSYKYIDNMSYANNFEENLLNNDYKLTLNNINKKIYKKGNINIIISSEFKYLIIVMSKDGIL